MQAECCGAESNSHPPQTIGLQGFVVQQAPGTPPSPGRSSRTIFQDVSTVFRGRERKKEVSEKWLWLGVIIVWILVEVPLDEEFDMNLFHFWDFPLESSGVDDFVGDWDDTKSECLGPIPLEMLMIDGIRKSKQLPSFAADSSGSQILDRMIFTDDQELGSFQTQSPVSALESTGSYSAGIFGFIPGHSRSKSIRQWPVLNHGMLCLHADSQVFVPKDSQYEKE